MRVPAVRRLASVSFLLVGLIAVAGFGPATHAKGGPWPYDWAEFDESGWSGMHSGSNTLESSISRANVGSLGLLFAVSLPDVADGAAAYLHSVPTPRGVKNLVFLTTRDGHILALNADNGATVWRHQYGPGLCMINNGTIPCFTTSSPAIGPSRTYVYSYGLDGRVHKYAVGTGSEITTGGWPETVTLKAFDEKESPALSIASTTDGPFLYVANGGYPGDNGDYQGHVTTINLSTGAQTVFNTLCSDQTVHFVEQPGSPDCSEVQSAVWARPGVVYDPHTNGGKGSIFFATGNGTFDPSNLFWGDSVLELSPNGTGGAGFGTPLDSYTPADFQTLQNDDSDLGSTAPAILPPAFMPTQSKYRDVAVQGGKDGNLRLLDLDNLSLLGGPGHTGGELSTVRAGGEVRSQPAVWVDPATGHIWVYVTGGFGLRAFTVTSNSFGTPHLILQWSLGGARVKGSPLVANGVLYAAASGLMEALNPLTGSKLWANPSIGPIHWESPVVADGVLYITDENGNLSAFAPTPHAARFKVSHQGGHAVFSWGASNTSATSGFFVRSGSQQLNKALIPVDGNYAVTTVWHSGVFTLYGVLISGRPLALASVTVR